MGKKIYITSLHLLHGGIEMAITSVSNALAKRGYEVEILCTYNLGEPAYPLDPRVKVTYLTDVRPNREAFRSAVARKNAAAILREGIYAIRVLYLKKKVLKDQFRRIKDGIIISTRNEDSVLLSRYGQKSVRKIAQLHHDHCFDKRLLNDFRNRYKNIDVLTLLTEQLRQEVVQVVKDNHRTQCVVMPNFLPDTEVEIQPVPRENQAVAVGRLHPVKGFLRLIRLWKLVYEKTGTVLKIIGGGEQQEELENEITTQGLEKGVILTGPMDHQDVLQEMKRSLVYAMTSINEGFGFVIIEAMAQGLPVVAYDVRVGPRAIIEDGKNGFLIPDGKEETFVEKVDLLLTDSEQREQMSRASLEHAADFTEETIMKQWEVILAET